VSTPRTRSRRTGRGWRVLGLAVLALLVLAIVVDRAAVHIAQNVAASKLQQRENLPSKPSVKISGFPFLTQLASGTFDDVTLDARELVVSGGGRSVTISSLHAELRGLSVSRDLSSATAASGTGRAVISYPALSRSVGTPVVWAGNSADARGRVRASKTVTVLGQSFSGSVSAEVVVSGRNTVSFASPRVQVSRVTVPQIVTEQFAGLLPPLTLNGLPSGLSVRQVTADAGGLVVDLIGHDVTVK
jgi:hypothetical protein